MVTAIRDQKFTLEEYFELERTSEKRFEYWDGHVFAMAGASSTRERIVSNSIFHLRTLLGRGCTILGSNMKVVVPDYQPYRYLDVTAICGEPVIEKVGGMEALVNPQLIIEILSPSTEAFDRRKNLPTTNRYPVSRSTYLLRPTSRASPVTTNRETTGY